MEERRRPRKRGIRLWHCDECNKDYAEGTKEQHLLSNEHRLNTDPNIARGETINSQTRTVIEAPVNLDNKLHREQPQADRNPRRERRQPVAQQRVEDNHEHIDRRIMCGEQLLQPEPGAHRGPLADATPTEEQIRAQDKNFDVLPSTGKAKIKIRPQKKHPTKVGEKTMATKEKKKSLLKSDKSTKKRIKKLEKLYRARKRGVKMVKGYI